MDDKAVPFWEDIPGGYIKLPKDLFRHEKYKNVSPTAKLLYGFLLDRTSLSASKGDSWKTERGEYYVIFTVREIAERMQCAHEKASKILKELVDAGLISRTRKRRSQAYHIVVHPVLPNTEKQKTGERKNRTVDSEKSDVNKTEDNNPDCIDPESITFLKKLRLRVDIENQISYDLLREKVPKEYLDVIVGVIVDTICSSRPELKVNGEVISVSKVRTHLRKVTEMDVHYVYERMRREKNDIQYLNGYILARLLEDEIVKEMYYDRWVSLDKNIINNNFSINRR